MKCHPCGRKAVIYLRQHNARYCREHFVNFVDRQVARAIKRKRMFGPDEKVMVAVSGGKDSLVLWHILQKAGYHTAGYHIHLGIGEYSLRSLDITRAFAAAKGLELFETDVESEYGLGISGLAKATGRPACSGCGLNKRYLMNRAAREKGFDVIATGHNLDDEAATLLGNVLNWQTGSLSRQNPVLAAGKGFTRRVKPLYMLSEREMAAYALLEGIRYIHEECPNAVGARSIEYKETLNRIEDAMPGSKMRFLKGFLDLDRATWQAESDAPVLRECEACGEPTVNNLCAFCCLWRGAERNKAVRDRGSVPAV